MSRTAPVEHYSGFSLIHISGPPYERGLQHGQLLRDRVRGLRDTFYRDVVYFRGKAWGLALQAVMAPILLIMRRHIPPELRLEMRGVADGAGVPYWDILSLNCFDDLLHSLWRIPAALVKWPVIGSHFACSSFALLGQRTASGRLLHGRNFDYEVAPGLASDGSVTRALKENLVVIDCRPDRGHGFVSVAWPGIVGAVTSINEAGLSLACLTSTIGTETPNGVPLPLLYRQIAQYAATLDEAEQLIWRARRTIGNNLLVASAREDDGRVFELSPQQVVARRPEDGVLVTTNHFVDPATQPHQDGWVIPNSLDRYARLSSLCTNGQCDLEQAGELLRDTHSLAVDGDVWSCLENPGTVYSTIAEPSSGRLWLRVNDLPDRELVELSASWVQQPARIPAA